ncbi:hypothetical protein FOA52_008276 [Chlamydomonas sp. UWO 241]|nr:hypothetical protein FOA52_008276 [Chlamydomonas sp. UWO 241]
MVERKILLPVDESEASLNTLKYVLQNIVRKGDSLHVVNILPRPTYNVAMLIDDFRKGDSLHVVNILPRPLPTYTVMAPLGPECFMNSPILEEDTSTMHKHTETKAAAYLHKKFVPLLEDAKVPYHTEVVTFAPNANSVGEMICQLAKDVDASMVAMAKHDQGTIQEFFLGSTTNHCAHHCLAPVLIVHADQ